MTTKRTLNSASLVAGTRLAESIDQIDAMPHTGSMVRGQPIDLTVRRRAVPRFPYHVVYLDLPTHIRVLAIAHDRRKPGYWNDRLK